jgi:hypothetical protein
MTDRRWKRTALVALTALVLVLAGWAATASIQWRHMQAAQEQAEQARQEAEQAREEERKAKDDTRRALYASQILLAEKAFTDGLDKP